MKKKTKKNIFQRIFKQIDKKLILPLTRLGVKFAKGFSNLEKTLETALTKSNTLLFVSLILAVAMFIVIDQKIVTFNENTAEILKDQKVTATFNEEAYVVEGLPETVDITLIGSRSDLFVAKQSSTSKVTVDLSGLKPGTHKVNIDYKHSSDSIDYSVNPTTATVIIYPKISETKPLTTDVLNQDKLNSTLVIERIDTEIDEVVVKGAEHQLAKVASVKALIDVNNIAKQEAKTITLKDIPLKAYDKDGNALNVEIVPGKISADITIASPSKTLPIKVITTGTIGFGKAISSLILSDDKVVVYGESGVVSELDYVPLDVDVSNLKEGKKYKLDLVKPVGVKSMSVNNITLEISLGDAESKDINDINIDVRNLADGYSVQGESANDIKVSVNVKGVKSVIDGLKSDDISAYIDLKGYKEGTFEVPVSVEGDDPRVTYLSKTKKVKVTIKKN